MTRQIQVESIINLPPLSIAGLLVSNNATDADHIVDISAGACRDINNNVDIVLGAANAEGVVNSAPLSVSGLFNGANGLDEGGLISNSMYAVYIIADSRGYEPVAGLLSLNQNYLPKMPFGYDSLRLVGFMATDSSANFFPGMTYGSGPSRTWYYDNFQDQDVINNGASTSFAPIDVSAKVPSIENIIVETDIRFNAGGLSETASLRKFGTVGPQASMVSSYIGINDAELDVFSGLDNGVATIEYSVTASDADIFIRGYKYVV